MTLQSKLLLLSAAAQWPETKRPFGAAREFFSQQDNQFIPSGHVALSDNSTSRPFHSSNVFNYKLFLPVTVKIHFPLSACWDDYCISKWHRDDTCGWSSRHPMMNLQVTVRKTSVNRWISLPTPHRTVSTLMGLLCFLTRRCFSLPTANS